MLYERDLKLEKLYRKGRGQYNHYRQLSMYLLTNYLT